MHRNEEIAAQANYNPSETLVTPPVTINFNIDDTIAVLERSVTYSATGEFTWWELTQNENALSLPGVSSRFPFIIEGRTFVKLEEGFMRGSGFLGGLTADTLCLVVDGQGFLWEIIERIEEKGAIRLKCEPIIASVSPGPAPIRVIISRFEEGGLVTVSGSGVNFIGKFPIFE